MKTLEELKETPGLCITGPIMNINDQKQAKWLAFNGWVEWPGFCGTVIFGRGEGKDGIMDHVSVSSYNRRKLPSWGDMCKLKDMFFYPDEMVVQIHPAAENYLHGVKGPGGQTLENVLHLWRPHNGDFSALNHPEDWQ